MKRVVLIRGGAIFALVLLVAGIFAVKSFSASASNADNARQCARFKQSADQKAMQDWQRYGQSVKHEQQLFEQNVSRDRGNAQKIKQDQQLYLTNLQKSQAYFTQQIKKDLAIDPACKVNISTSLSPVPTFPAKDLTPPPLPTWTVPSHSGPSAPKPVPTVVPTPTHVPPTDPTVPPTPTATRPVGGSANGNEQQLAMQLLTLINSNRAAHGLPAYTLNSTLSNGAYQHDLTMASPQCGKLMHQCPGEPSPSQRVTNEGVKWMATGENIGEASYPDPWQGIQVVHQQMVNEGPSGGHYQNLFSSAYHQIGIGVLIDAKGTVWITEDFTN